MSDDTNLDSESYSYDEPTPADDVLMTEDGAVILRMGEPPIPVNCGATCAEEIPGGAESAS